MEGMLFTPAPHLESHRMIDSPMKFQNPVLQSEA